jgi:hypothetical protein
MNVFEMINKPTVSMTDYGTNTSRNASIPTPANCA